VQEPVNLQELPHLKELCWDRAPYIDADGLYRLLEERWQYLDTDRLMNTEKAYIKQLIADHGNRFLGRGFHDEDLG
jgi:hypothetical protein